MRNNKKTVIIASPDGVASNITEKFYEKVSLLFRGTTGENFNTSTEPWDLRLKHGIESLNSTVFFEHSIKRTIKKSQPTVTSNDLIQGSNDVSIYVYGPLPRELLKRWFSRYYSEIRDINILTSIDYYKETRKWLVTNEVMHTYIREPVGNESTRRYVKKICEGVSGEIYGIGYEGEAFLNEIEKRGGEIFYLGTSGACTWRKKSVINLFATERDEVGIEVKQC
jgi:hypothetical protein